MSTPAAPQTEKPKTASGLVVGKNKGHQVTRRDVSATRQARAKSKPSSEKIKAVRSLIKEVAGLSPYEKRLLDMVKVLGASADKKMYKLAKKRLGSHKRAMKKREEIKDLMTAIRSRQ